jgi:hypothetical protein
LRGKKPRSKKIILGNLYTGKSSSVAMFYGGHTPRNMTGQSKSSLIIATPSQLKKRPVKFINLGMLPLPQNRQLTHKQKIVLAAKFNMYQIITSKKSANVKPNMKTFQGVYQSISWVDS